MAARKTTTEVETNAITPEVLKESMVALGVQLCCDVRDGRAKQPIETLGRIVDIYAVIK